MCEGQLDYCCLCNTHFVNPYIIVDGEKPLKKFFNSSTAAVISFLNLDSTI